MTAADGSKPKCYSKPKYKATAHGSNLRQAPLPKTAPLPLDLQNYLLVPILHLLSPSWLRALPLRRALHIPDLSAQPSAGVLGR